MNATAEQMSAALVATQARTRLMPVDISEWDVARSMPMDMTFAPLSFDETNKAVECHRAVVNEVGEFIAPVSFRYTIIQHKDLLNQLTKHLTILGMTPDSIQMHLSQNHTRMRLRVFFTDNSKEITVGDTIQLGIEVINRHDRSSSAILKLVAKRLACTNGMTVSDTLDSFSQWHTGEWDGEELDNWLLTTTDAFASFIDNQMSPLLATPMTYAQFGKLLTAPDEPVSEDDPEADLHRGLNKRTTKRIINRFQQYADELGENAWAGYNAFTHFASHETSSVEQSERIEKLANTFAKLAVA